MGYALLTGKPLTAATALLSRMPGRHKGIGMKRAVKKKVVVVETAPPADESTGNTGAEQRAASHTPVLPSSHAAQVSPGEKKLRQAENELNEWKMIAAKAQRAEQEEARRSCSWPKGSTRRRCGAGTMASSAQTSRRHLGRWSGTTRRSWSLLVLAESISRHNWTRLTLWQCVLTLCCA